MVAMLQRSELQHWSRIKRSAGIVAELRRGNLSGEFTVVPGSTTTTIEGGGVVYTSRQADFLARITEVNLDGNPTQPRAEDRIIAFDQAWEVLPQDGERHWDPAGNYGVMMRIHTRWIGPFAGGVTGAVLVNDDNLVFVRDDNGVFLLAPPK